MAREVFVLEERDGDEFVAFNNALYTDRALAEHHRQLTAEALDVECRLVRYVPESELEALHACNLANTAELHRADEQIGYLKESLTDAIRILSGVMGGEDRAVDAAVKLLNANKEIEW